MMKKRKHNKIGASSPTKVSEMIEQFATNYISMGETDEERQNYLNSACTAWNIAVLPEHARESAIRHVVEDYKRHNFGVDDAEDYSRNLRTLIVEKLGMFPDAKMTIVQASLEHIGDKKYRLNVVSTDQRDSRNRWPKC
jgi:hypothetical protein